MLSSRARLSMHACAHARTVCSSMSTSPPKSPMVHPLSARTHWKSQNGFTHLRPRSSFGNRTAIATENTARMSANRLISLGGGGGGGDRRMPQQLLETDFVVQVCLKLRNGRLRSTRLQRMLHSMHQSCIACIHHAYIASIIRRVLFSATSFLYIVCTVFALCLHCVAGPLVQSPPQNSPVGLGSQILFLKIRQEPLFLKIRQEKPENCGPDFSSSNRL